MLSATQLPNPNLPWPVPLSVVYDVAHDEQGPRGGCALVSYLCPAGKWTNGWGETDGVGPGMRWTKAYADQRLCDGLTERANAVRAMCTVLPTANQLAALVRLSYNIGLGALARSSIIRAHNAGDVQAAGRAFNLYIHSTNPATGKFHNPPLPGLVSRRARESALYLTPDPDDYHQPAPQAVAPESSLARSPIAVSGAVTSATGVITAVFEAEATAPAVKPDVMGKVEQVGKQAGQVKTAVQHVRELAVDTLGLPAGALFPAVLIVAGLCAVWWRHKQRRGGWA
jgi:lysozyme